MNCAATSLPYVVVRIFLLLSLAIFLVGCNDSTDPLPEISGRWECHGGIPTYRTSVRAPGAASVAFELAAAGDRPELRTTAVGSGDSNHLFDQEGLQAFEVLAQVAWKTPSRATIQLKHTPQDINAPFEFLQTYSTNPEATDIRTTIIQGAARGSYQFVNMRPSGTGRFLTILDACGRFVQSTDVLRVTRLSDRQQSIEVDLGKVILQKLSSNKPPRVHYSTSSTIEIGLLSPHADRPESVTLQFGEARVIHTVIQSISTRCRHRGPGSLAAFRIEEPFSIQIVAVNSGPLSMEDLCTEVKVVQLERSRVKKCRYEQGSERWYYAATYLAEAHTADGIFATKQFASKGDTSCPTSLEVKLYGELQEITQAVDHQAIARWLASNVLRSAQ